MNEFRMTSEKGYLNQQSVSTPRLKIRFVIQLIVALIAFVALYRWNLSANSATAPLNKFLECSISKFNKSSLDDPLVKPITREEFVERRNRLARALVHDGIDAFIVEPGFTFVYYGNVSSFTWESWEPEERPFLMIIEPIISLTGSIVARTSFVVAAFEAARARQLHIPLASDEQEIQTFPWEEHENPYGPISKILGGTNKRVTVDEEMRSFILHGIMNEGFEVVPITDEVAAVKMVKSEQEIAIIGAVNTLTIEGIKATQKCAYYGVTEIQYSKTLDLVLETAGIEPFFDLVLFGTNAACPHCSSGMKVLVPGDFILIDAGGHLHGLSSDVCRTFLLPIDPAKDKPLDKVMQRRFKIWQIAMDAQTASVNASQVGARASDIDIAARKVIEDAGYENGFTHRVGHGIGIKAHEPPYLNKANRGTILRAGVTYTSEPGIYLEGDIGVRHEDIILVSRSGPVVLTPRAISPWEP